MGRWEYLSYELNSGLSNYGGNAGIEIEWVRNMANGDTSNNSALRLPSHTGTHIDYPFHFSVQGKTGSAYGAGQHIFESVQVLDITGMDVKDYLIRIENLPVEPDDKITFLVIKTGFCNIRAEEKYWKYNWGFAPETADFLRSRLPSLRAIGFDLISLSAYQQRETGRIAHKEFLEKNDILIIEDMDLSVIQTSSKIHTLVVSPLRFEGADGTPVTVFANLD